MKNLLPALLALVAIGAVVWALMPSEAPSTGATRAANTTATATTPAPATGPATRPSGLAAPATRATAATGRTATDRAAQVARGEVDPDALAAALTRKGPAAADLPTGTMPKGPILRPTDPGAQPTGEAPRWGRAGKEPFRTEPARIKDTVRAWYGNLSKTGPVPPLRLEEIYPADVIAELNLPAGGIVTQLGGWPASDRRAFNDVLALPDDSASALGVTVQTPEGGTVREYVFLGGTP